MSMYMTRPVPSIIVPDSGGALLGTIQDSTGMGRDIVQVTPLLVITPTDRIRVPADQATMLRLQRMPRHNFSSGRTRSPKGTSATVKKRDMLASHFHVWAQSNLCRRNGDLIKSGRVSVKSEGEVERGLTFNSPYSSIGSGAVDSSTALTRTSLTS